MIGGHDSASLNENSVLAFLTRTVSLDSKKCKKKKQNSHKIMEHLEVLHNFVIYFTSLAMRFLLFGDQISTEQMTVADQPIAFLSSIDRCAGNLARDVSHLW